LVLAAEFEEKAVVSAKFNRYLHCALVIFVPTDHHLTARLLKRPAALAGCVLLQRKPILKYDQVGASK
jgi:hypothetical protein